MGESAPAQAPRVVTLEFEGTFDADGVVRARRELAKLSERDHLVLDLGKAHDVDWCALASLGAEFAPIAPERVSLTGYCGQHARLLTWLGFGALLRHPTF